MSLAFKCTSFQHFVSFNINQIGMIDFQFNVNGPSKEQLSVFVWKDIWFR